jgi:hypothetical protein
MASRRTAWNSLTCNRNSGILKSLRGIASAGLCGFHPDLGLINQRPKQSISTLQKLAGRKLAGFERSRARKGLTRTALFSRGFLIWPSQLAWANFVGFESC